MHISELINPASLRHDIDNGLIRTQVHPTLGYKIFNYTDRAQCSKSWSKATLHSRGLIVDLDGKIIARPFPKFFNWNEPKPKGYKTIGMDDPVSVVDKLDGSLGILYPTGYGKYAIATRGSFASDQAIHATEIWNRKYQSDYAYMIRPTLTYLFEIIYPENRIVVDYRGLDDLVLLGAVEIETGRVLGPEMFPGWPGPRVEPFPFRTLAEAVEAKPRPGMEGYVVRNDATGQMVKVKYDDYVSLHRIVTGLNEREVWRRTRAALEADGITFHESLLQDIPDELHEWVKEVAKNLTNDYFTRQSNALGTFLRITDSVANFGAVRDNRETRKWFASQIGAKPSWLQKALWILYDNKNPMDFIWGLIEPKGNNKP